MRTLGMIGGTGPESTIDYYRLLNEEYKRKRPGEGNPPILMNCINYVHLMAYMEPRDWRGMAEMLSGEFDKLRKAGADFGLISANTPHICYEYLAPICSIPLINIVDVAAAECRNRGYTSVALLGTRLTMESDFYREAFATSGISVITPNENDRAWVNQKYFDELFEGTFLDETREGFLEVMGKMQGDAVVLGGTELPLLLRDVDVGVPLVDTARVHCASAVKWMLRA